MKRYPEYKSSDYEWLGEVPNHWKVKAFKHCAFIESGLVDPQLPEHVGRTLIAPNHVESGTGRILAEETAGEQGADSGKYLFDSGVVVYSKIRPALVKACIPLEGGLCSADMYPLTPQPDVDSRFLLYVLLSDFFTDQAVLASERVAMPKVNRDTLNDFRIALPPLDEQRHLAAYLDRKTSEVDTLIRKKQALIARLGELRAALIHRAVTKGLDPDVPMKDSGVEWLGKVPEHWTMTRLKHVLSDIGTGGTPSTSDESYWAEDGEGIPWVAISDMTAQSVITRTAKNVTEAGLDAGRLQVLPEGTLLISIFASLGKTSILGVDAAVNQAILGLVPGADIDREFLRLYLAALEPFISYYSSSNTQENLNLTKIKNLDLPLPPVEEQKRVVHYLQTQGKKLRGLIAREEQIIKRLQELRTALISEVVTGRVDVRGQVLANAASVAEVAAA